MATIEISSAPANRALYVEAAASIDRAFTDLERVIAAAVQAGQVTPAVAADLGRRVRALANETVVQGERAALLVLDLDVAAIAAGANVAFYRELVALVEVLRPQVQPPAPGVAAEARCGE